MARNARILSRFRGCLVGSLIGDCFGFPFENERNHSYNPAIIQETFDETLQKSPTELPIRQYTDDTSMTVSVAKFLLEGTSLNYRKLAERFCEAYSTETKERGYGSHVHKVFSKLKETNFVNAFQPASLQFRGHGSLGNGSGMRVAPIALCTFADQSLHRLVNIAINVSRITHTHPKGVVGGIFQTLAVRQALQSGLAEEKPEPIQFLNAFESDFQSVIADNEAIPSIQDGYEEYQKKLGLIRKYIETGSNSWEIDEIKRELGVKVTAVESIPTALFCFLAAFKEIPFIEADNHFQRTVQLAVCLGGDTDTIASMAGAICGAFVGVENIDEKFIKNCEDHEKVLALAEKLYDQWIQHDSKL